MWFTESKHNPFRGCALAAAAAAERVAIRTANAVTAQVAWGLAALPAGRFSFGLRAQVKTPIARPDIPIYGWRERWREVATAVRSVAR